VRLWKVVRPGLGRGTYKSTFCKPRGSVNVRFAPKATEVLRCREASLCAITGSEQVQQKSLLDHLVSDGEHVRRNPESERRRRLEIEHELELGWLKHREVARLGAIEDAARIDAGLVIAIRKVSTVAHEAASLADQSQAS